MKSSQRHIHHRMSRFELYFYSCSLFALSFAIASGSLSVTIYVAPTSKDGTGILWFWSISTVFFFVTYLVCLILGLRHPYDRKKLKPVATLIAFVVLFFQVGSAALYAYLSKFVLKDLNYIGIEFAFAAVSFVLPFLFLLQKKGADDGSQAI
jgi:hypothetical protein